MLSDSLRRLSRIVVVALLAGCAAAPSPQQTTGWRDPGYKGPPFTKVFVVGLSAQSLVDQRGFEDLMVATLQRGGVTAVPGWQFVPPGVTPDQATMRAAVARSGADATLLVRMSGFQTETGVGYGVGASAAVAPGMYVGWYEPGLASYNYQAATIYTTLFDVRSERPVWTFNPPAYDPASLRQQAPAFAEEVVGMLLSSGLVAVFPRRATLRLMRFRPGVAREPHPCGGRYP